MTRPQLEQLKVALEELKRSATRQADRMILIQSASSNSTQFFVGSSSSNVAAAPPMPPPPQVFQSPSAIQNHEFDGSMMPPSHHGFGNNMGGYGGNNMGGYGSNNMGGYGGPGFY